ncbi:nitroreductase family protein [Proteiniborus sp. MB09-C3]|uniref:nitroreductase family protein n=1 Tax=Proteiniborus sp. MB09-C3 TaxID=3050072 RepID=UPI002553C15B|nr:nitroreductase family protein [Proteiniborus sp. MB09-C3]WIV13786.1 nitroreductase family protein [Proteiniborus sp. MB09-C3]
MEFTKTIKMRRSTRSYKPEQITSEELDKVLYAAYAAPVGNGLYEDVHLTVVQNSDLLNRIVKSTAEVSKNPDANPFYGAPTIVIVSTKLKDASKIGTTYANAACIVENMHLAATDIGLGSVYLLGFIRAGAINDSLKQELGIPEGYNPTSAITLGYPTEKLVERDIPANKISTNYIK